MKDRWHLSGHRILLIAPGEREEHSADFLSRKGALVTRWSHPDPTPGSYECFSLALLPFHLPQEDSRRNRILAFLDSVLPLVRVVAMGMGNQLVREVVSDRALLVEIAPRDDFALLNAVPTAEGAIAWAMESSDLTLAWERCLVLGYGRVGRVLAPRLRGLGAEVKILARSARDLAAARADGMGLAPLGRLPEEIREASFVFNSIPAPVIGYEVLVGAKTGAVLVDLASSPGGIDLQAARDLGVTAMILPGLPGIVAPRTAGFILARVLDRIWLEAAASLSGDQ